MRANFLQRGFLAALVGLAIFSPGGLLPSESAHAEEIAIGVGEFSKELNFLGSRDLVARIVRAGATRALLAPESSLVSLDLVSAATASSAESSDALKAAKPQMESMGAAKSTTPYRLSIADSVTVDAARSAWSFRIRSGEMFSNGLPVRIEDVVFSLNRCIRAGLLPSDLMVSAAQRSTNRGVPEAWVFVSSKAPRGDATADLTWSVFAGCPILEEGSSEAFGSALGEGSNLVSSGYFHVEDFYAGREIVLARTRSRIGGFDAGASKITVRGFRDMRHALTALRTGTIDLLFTEDEDILARGRSDQTLLLAECSGYRILQRKGLQVRCGTQIELNELRYLS